MSRALIAPIVVFAALTSCATITGLADKEAVDCPGDCDATAPPPRPDLDGGTDANVVVDTGPPKCNPSTDAECMPLPAGWSFVARAPLPAGGNQIACPSGMTNPTLVDESPTAQASACTCDTCTPTAQATCSGQVGYTWGPSTTCPNTGDPTHYKNVVAGTCYQDMFTGIWTANINRFVLPAPSGGACSASPTKHADRVSYGEKSQLCADASRCSGGFCDARVDAPFAVCVGRDEDEPCPQGFPAKHLVGSDGAQFDCGACSCTVNRAACQGSVNHYTDNFCLLGLVAIPANGTCGGPSTEDASFDSYKVVATSATTCSTSGSAPATNARMTNPRTICCR